MLSGKCVAELSTPHPNSITHVCYGSRGNLSTAIATSKDNTISYIDCYTYNPIKVLRSPEFRTASDWTKSSFSFNDINHVVSGSNDGSVFIWNTLSGEVESILNKSEHNSAVIASYWTRIGLLTADRMGKLILWK